MKIASLLLTSAFVAVAFGASAAQPQGAQAIPHSRNGNVEMILIPAGEFAMGSSRGMESPQRKVYLDAYMIGKYDVTVGQFKAYCAAKRISFSQFAPPTWGWIDSHPMVNVSWQEARNYCKWAGGDLPTEAQWEKAARGTDGREFPWGQAFDPSRLWRSTAHEADALSTIPVGKFPSGASPYGCLDIVGNVWQWCLDWSGPNYSGQPDRNPTGPDTGEYRVLRGGSWNWNKPDLFRCAFHHGDDPIIHISDVGFRLASRPSL